MEVFVSPHADDEALFGAFTLLRHRPLVYVCFQSRRARHLCSLEQREAETAAAMEVLGCEFVQPRIPCDPPDFEALEQQLLADFPSPPDRVWAPLPEEDGNSQHNRTGELCAQLWPGRVSFYATYTGPGHRSRAGELVEPEPGWDVLKQAAMDCYVSQKTYVGTAYHWQQGLDEYVASCWPLRLNLGAGPNPLPGYVNLDKASGWLFEDGLQGFKDGSVAAITVSHVLMYVAAEHWPFVFSECERVLKPGGVLRVTEDSTGDPDSRRFGLRHRASVATTPELVLAHMDGAGLAGRRVAPQETVFVDDTLIQQNYGEPPLVFHAEAVKP